MGSPGRREIGHGALAEKALLPVIPPEDKFPYTIRLVSEVLSSNGSTSMASVCGSTLSLMDAGVPISDPVAGISIGLVTKGNSPVLLTDIAGIEDFNGDMDFKVAGTKKGITAVQVDIKVEGLSLEIVKSALSRAKTAREYILGQMLEVISEPRKRISRYAPKVILINIPEDKIGELIGPGGKTIRALIAETGCDINVEDDGTVTIIGLTQEAVTTAAERIKALTKEVAVGEILEGEVKRLQPFGVFVEYSPGKEGLIHISRLGSGVRHPGDVLKIGQKVKVVVREIDELGRVNLDLAKPIRVPGIDGPRGPARPDRFASRYRPARREQRRR
jgi:polyribonucleotide nucleotidyltransferase